MRLSKYIYLLTIGFLNIKSMESNSRKYCSKDDTYCNYTRLSTGLNEDTIEISRFIPVKYFFRPNIFKRNKNLRD